MPFAFGEVNKNVTINTPSDITVENSLLITVEIFANNKVVYYGNQVEAYVYHDEYSWKCINSHAQGVFANTNGIAYFIKKQSE